MKAPLALAASFAFGILGILTGVGISRLSYGPGTRTGSVDATDIALLESRLAAVEGRLAKAPGSEALPAEPREGNADPAQATLDSSAASKAGTVKGVSSKLDEETAAAPSTKLERWLDSQGMRQDLEGFIAKSYDQNRSARRQREQEEAAARDREMREMSEGPYGRHNFKVNSLAKKLDLDARQKDYLFGLLEKYDDRIREAQAQIQPGENEKQGPEELQHHMKEFITLQHDLSQQFGNDLNLGLNESQQEAFKALPEGERGLNGGDRILFGDGIRVFAGADGAAGELAVPLLRKMTFTEKAAPPPK